MTKSEGGLVMAIFVLLFLMTIMVCIEWQQRKNEMIKFEILKSEIQLLQEKNQTQDDLISAIIRTEAMSGKFDKKE